MPKKKTSRKKKAADQSAPHKGKTVKESQAEYTEVVLPGEANTLGNILGGRVMHLMDITAAIACHRHSNSYVVTVSVDYLDFRLPVKLGQLIVLQSSVNRVFNTSMEAGVKVFAEDILTGERKHTSSAYLTFVAVGEDWKPKVIHPVVPKTKEEKRRYEEAGKRRRLRLAQRYKRKPKKR